MDDFDQTFVPESFLALYRDRQRRLTVTRVQLVGRYDLCEDMASLLVDHCQAAHATGTSQAEVLGQCLRGLRVAPPQVSAAEAAWVTQRTAELLGWPWAEAPLDEPAAARK